jgi:hypothetical protein
MNRGSRPPGLPRAGKASISAVAVLGLGLQAGVPAAQAAACFHPGDRPSPNMEVYQQAPPPAAGRAGDSAYYPATAFATLNLDSLRSAEAGTANYYFQWANRATVGVLNARGQPVARKLNLQPGDAGSLGPRTAFTTIDKANACTLAQTAAVLGREASEVDRIALSAGVRAVRLAPGDKAGLASARDVCVVLNRPLPPGGAGVMLDYEVQDGRSEAQTVQFLTAFADLVHKAGRRAILFSDPLDAPSQVYTGITAANAGQLARVFDGMTLLVWAGNAQGDVRASFDKQFDIITHGGGVDPRRLIAVFELANTTPEDARATREAMLRRGLGGVMFWRNGAQQGGDCASPINRKIACLALGRCDSGPASPPHAPSPPS